MSVDADTVETLAKAGLKLSVGALAVAKGVKSLRRTARAEAHDVYRVMGSEAARSEVWDHEREYHWGEDE